MKGCPILVAFFATGWGFRLSRQGHLEIMWLIRSWRVGIFDSSKPAQLSALRLELPTVLPFS